MRSKSIGLAICGIVLAVAVVLPSTIRAAGPEGSGQVSALLAEARQAAARAWWAAAEMEQFRLSRVGWETHTAKLTEITGMINNVARTAAQLNERRGEATPAQRQEIDRITRALGPLVASYETTLAHLRENHQNIEGCVQGDPHYHALLKTNAELTEALARR